MKKRRIFAVIISMLVLFFNISMVQAHESTSISNDNLTILRKLGVESENNNYTEHYYFKNILSYSIISPQKEDSNILISGDSIEYINNVDIMSSDSINSLFNSNEDLIKYIEQNIIKDSSYILSNSSLFDKSTTVYKFSKVINNIVDPYNNYLVYVNNMSHNLLLLRKNNVEHNLNFYSKFIDKETVLDNLVNKYKNIKYEGMFVHNDSNSNNYHIVYKFSTELELIYVNSTNSEIVEIEPLKATRYGVSMGVPDFSTTQESIKLAKNKLTSMGYYNIYSLTTAYLGKYVLPNLTSSINAFYITAHGNDSVLSSQKKGVTDSDRIFGKSKVPKRNYTFVYLDSCKSALNDGWASAFNINNNSKYKAFIGWKDNVGVTEAIKFNREFWKLVSKNKSLRKASIEAASKSGTTKIRFIGDINYDGYKR